MDPQQPVPDDVEGHGFVHQYTADTADTDDVEGHSNRIRMDGDDTDDVEGHSNRIHLNTGDDTDDVAGHLTGALGNKQKEDREY
jgi:hypothetical protein